MNIFQHILIHSRAFIGIREIFSKKSFSGKIFTTHAVSAETRYCTVLFNIDHNAYKNVVIIK